MCIVGDDGDPRCSTTGSHDVLEPCEVGTCTAPQCFACPCIRGLGEFFDPLLRRTNITAVCKCGFTRSTCARITPPADIIATDVIPRPPSVAGSVACFHACALMSSGCGPSTPRI